jgi:hypothetical protein
MSAPVVLGLDLNDIFKGIPSLNPNLTTFLAFAIPSHSPRE